MRVGYRVTLGILTVMILITMTIGTSYSFYSVSDEQENPNSLATTCFKIEFKDGQDDINITNAYPMDDDKALQGTPHTFTIHNTCTRENSAEGINYKIILSSLKLDGEDVSKDLTSQIKYKLVENGDVVGTTGTKLSEANLYNDLPENIKSTHNIDKSYLLKDSGILNFDETKTYKLYLWINSEAGNEVMTNKFKGKIIIYADI